RHTRCYRDWSSDVCSSDLIVFGSTRSAIVDTLLVAIGVERTAVLVYVLQRSFDALVVAAAITPIFLWLLGSSAIHAAARFRGVRSEERRVGKESGARWAWW